MLCLLCKTDSPKCWVLELTTVFCTPSRSNLCLPPGRIVHHRKRTSSIVCLVGELLGPASRAEQASHLLRAIGMSIGILDFVNEELRDGRSP